MNHQIKRGVSLYSYQEEFFLRKMNLEDCIAAVAKTGATGIEMLGEQSIVGFPKLSDAFIDQWFGWMDKHGTTPVCHDMFLDTKRFKGHFMTEDEQLASVIRDIKFANRLGFKIIRVIVSTSSEIMERAAPYAEEYDVKLGIEIHSPWYINSAWMTRHHEVMEKTGSKYLGFIPDMGMFTKRLAKVMTDRLIRQGADEKIVEFVCQQHEKAVMAEYIIAEVRQMSQRPIDNAVAELTRHNIYNNLSSFLPFMDKIFHIHAKFYDKQDDYTEYSIPYKEIIEVLKKGGFNGYLSSEYEGNRHIQDIYEVDSVEQLFAKTQEISLGNGLEIVGFQTLKGFPFLTNSQIKEVKYLIEKYEFEPACLDANVDVAIRRNGNFSIDETVEYLMPQIKVASDLGFPVVRIQMTAKPEVIRKLIAVAEKAKVKLGMELHTPYSVNHPQVMALRELYAEIDSPYLGFIPDFGTSMRAIPEALLHSFRSAGVTDEQVNITKEIWAKDIPTPEKFAELYERVAALGAAAPQIGRLNMAFSMNG